MFVVRFWDLRYRGELILNVSVFVVRVGKGGIEKNCTEYYCVCYEVPGRALKEELILNVTLFVVRVWGVCYREELILNVTVFVVRVWGLCYREELILNITELNICGYVHHA